MENNVEKIDLDHVDWKSSREFFESLGEALDKLDDKDESYDFTWVGKRRSIIEAGAPINKTLRPDIEASKDFDNTKNMLIVGDNLDALKLLQESYLGKIKMIYIDPPYNTGHDFVYRDNFSIKKADFEDSTTDSEGTVVVSEDEYAENAKSNGRFHSDWLSMMYPRLRLARNLLTDDGAIFISIGQEEIDNTIKLVKEVFGEYNYLSTISRVTKKSSNSGDFFAPSVDYIVVATKNAQDVNSFRVEMTKELEAGFNLEDDRGKYKIVGFYQASLELARSRFARYYIDAPDGHKCIPPEGKRWRTIKETYDNLLAENRIVFKETATSPLLDENGNRSKWNVYTKSYMDERAAGGYVPREYIEDIQNNLGTIELGKLGIPFDFAKPSKLVSYLASFNKDKDEYILDFFAGSGTSGHAAMTMNASDNGNRKFILVQINEETDEKSQARKAGYNTVDELTIERLRKAGDTFDSDKIDTGFRVFRIDDSNEKSDIRKPLGEIRQSNIFDMVDNVKKDRTPLDLLFGVVYASALPFDLKLEKRKIGENIIYLYGYLDEGTGLVACFDDKVPEETIKELAKLKPLTAAFKDTSFEDSAEKINLSEHFRIISPDTKVKVL